MDYGRPSPTGNVPSPFPPSELKKAKANRGRRGFRSFKLFAVGFVAVLVIMDPGFAFSVFEVFWLFMQFVLLHVVDLLMQISMVPLRLVMIMFKVAMGPFTKVPYWCVKTYLSSPLEDEMINH